MPMSDRSALGVPGEVVIARVANPLENPHCRGEHRPVVLVRRDGGHWMVMGLTTSPLYGDNTPRTPVPHPYEIGLNGPGYLWSSRLTRVSVLDIGSHIGWVDPALAATIIAQARLMPEDAAGLVWSLGQSSPEAA
ncbi:MAG: hypothetical protein M3O70_08600 [Actinomycetota bacterium]|nr:hypothetical protein [Actinomycetota bacterium]